MTLSQPSQVRLQDLLRHCDDLHTALGPFRSCAATLQRWGEELARVLHGGGRLLVAGNGGSAAQAQHLTAEVVGRYREDRACTRCSPVRCAHTAGPATCSC
jgi:phosphoheptose isomerase